MFEKLYGIYAGLRTAVFNLIVNTFRNIPDWVEWSVVVVLFIIGLLFLIFLIKNRDSWRHYHH